jgi:DNA modification methylase
MIPEVEQVLSGERQWFVQQSDCLAFLRGLPDDCVSLVFGSPPYEEARLYLEGGQDLGVSRKTDEWVAWMVEVFRECKRVCTGLVAFVVAGQTRDFRWSAGPALLTADLHRAGFNLRNPPIYHRVGIPGSGSKDWLRSDYEWIICTSRPGQLPWSDNTAAGHPPKWKPGGEMSYRTLEGDRVNVAKQGMCDRGGNRRRPDGTRELLGRKGRRVTSGHKNGDTPNSDSYDPPQLANPGNVISLKVGGGLMGSELCHENEAPFPEELASFFIRSFCKEGEITLDPFSGSGTSVAVAVANNRRGLACDLRESQVLLSRKRIATVTPLGLFQE